MFGDAVLTGVAKVLEETVRENDIVARFGGEEFVVVMPNTDHHFPTPVECLVA